MIAIDITIKMPFSFHEVGTACTKTMNNCSIIGTASDGRHPRESCSWLLGEHERAPH